VSYLTTCASRPNYGKCRSEVFARDTAPAHTLLNIVQLAWPGMMVEVDVTAVVREVESFRGAASPANPNPYSRTVIIGSGLAAFAAPRNDGAWTFVLRLNARRQAASCAGSSGSALPAPHRVQVGPHQD